jgi:hypothetical protein
MREKMPRRYQGTKSLCKDYYSKSSLVAEVTQTAILTNMMLLPKGWLPPDAAQKNCSS